MYHTLNGGDSMSIRNFWVEVEIDGRKTTFKGGPRNKNGGMRITLYQRDNGKIIKPLKIACLAFDTNGVITLNTTVFNTLDDFSDSWGYEVPMSITTDR